MKIISRLSLLPCSVLLCAQLAWPPWSQSASNPGGHELQANMLEIPRQILKTGVSLTTSVISPSSRQLADTINLTPVLERLQKLRRRALTAGDAKDFESLEARQDLWAAKQEAALIIERTDLDIDFTIAEIDAESQVYQEILSTFLSDRDKLLAHVNAATFINNGVVWSTCESFALPAFNTVYAKNPRHVIQCPLVAGIIGCAGITVSTAASMYALGAVNGKKKTSEVDPNMLSKLFGYPANPEIEYPKSVWQYLHQVPADDPKAKKRLDQLVDLWIADQNLPSFTDRKSKTQLDVLTANLSQPGALSIATLKARTAMLQQLHSEIMKMKRMLLELAMVVQGEKQVRANY